MWNWKFFRAKCPVTLEDRRWTEQSLSWLCRQFSVDSMLQNNILPNDKYFPDHFDDSQRAIMCLLHKVCEYMKVDPAVLDIRLCYEKDDQGLTEVEGLRRSAAGTIQHSYRPQININLSENRTPTGLVATMAHELCHYLVDRHITEKQQPYWEPLIDLATVFFGFGIFTANAKIQEKTTLYQDTYSWSISSLGYLPLEIICYALSLIAWAKEQQNPTWGGIPR